MLRYAETFPGFPSTLVVLLLLTASCGDLQDPASGPSARIAAGPAAQTPDPNQPLLNPSSETSHSASLLAQDPAGSGLRSADAVPTQAMSIPEAQEPSGNPQSSQPVLPFNSPPADGIGDLPPWQTRESPTIQTINLSWTPSPSGNAEGYKVYVTSDATAAPYYLDVGPATHLAISLLTGHRYAFTVVAYNTAGESAPADPVSLDLL